MRILVLLLQRDVTMSARLLGEIAAALVQREHQLTLVVERNTPLARDITARFPHLNVKTVPAGNAFGRLRALRQLVRVLRIDAVLVGSARDGLRAAYAIGRRGGVVRRLAIGERFESSWQARLAASRTTFLLLGDEIGERVHTVLGVRAAVSWPAPTDVVSANPSVRRPSDGLAPELAIVTGASNVAATYAAGAMALRAAARLLVRHPDLRVLLLGDSSSLQAMRLHAASVGLSDRTSVVPLNGLLEPGAFDVEAVWVADGGDRGAISVLAAMMRRIPVVVPRGFDIESLVAHRITGFVADDADLAENVSALSRLFADEQERNAMGAAGAARAERLHGWEGLIDRTVDALRRAAGPNARPRQAA